MQSTSENEERWVLIGEGKKAHLITGMHYYPVCGIKRIEEYTAPPNTPKCKICEKIADYWRKKGV
jgi:hypothetical protein